jgi:hypothetical protein
MADDAVNRSLAIMMPQYKKDFADCMATKAVEWYWSKRHGIWDYDQGGRKVEWRASLSETSPFGWTGAMEEHTPTLENTWQIAELEWRGLAHQFVCTYAEKMLCKQEWQIIKLLGGLTKIMTRDWVKEWGTQFYSDGTRLSNTAFHGLGASIGTSAATYANLSQTTFTNWDCQRIDATGFAADPLNFLQQLQLSCAVGEAGGRDENEIDIFLCTKTDFRVVCQSEVVKQRYEQDIEMAKAGFKNVSVWGVPLAYSEYCTANRIFGLNSKLFEIQTVGADAIDTGVQTPDGFPFGITLGYAVALHQMLNLNPRGSGLLYNTGS